MDTKKLEEIVTNSDLSEEAKSLILRLIPYAPDRPDVQEEILKVMEYEKRMSELSAEEAEEITRIADLALKELDSVDEALEEETNKIMEDVSKKLNEIYETMSGGDAPAQDAAPAGPAPEDVTNPAVDLSTPPSVDPVPEDANASVDAPASDPAMDTSAAPAE